ncbi:MAG: IS21-like element helper ATPase IstB [Cyanobacteria bacterium SZAS LIN-5]|nr:IS21-like element helper ATPase IstB [Cyanobacteria bacterium SZAS LIN-5]
MDRLTKQSELEMLLHSFRLPSFAENYQKYAREAEKGKLDHVEYLFSLSKIESEDRYNRKTERLIKAAKLPKGKTLEKFDVSRFKHLSQSQIQEIGQGAGLDKAENLLIFGNPGTGKTHLAAAIGREWCMQGREIFFSTASALVQELLTAKRDLRLNSLLKRLDKFDAIIIDDISYIPQNREETDVLFVLLAERYERRSIVITSNLPFSQWDQVFKDTVTTMAAVDRLVHHAIVLELNGESYRAQSAANRKERQLPAAQK